MKNYFNKEQIAQLKEAEPYFRTVIECQYKRATSNQLNTLVADLYDAVTGGKCNRNWGCGVCAYTLYQQCGQLYFESIAQQQPETPVENKQIEKTSTTKSNGKAKKNTSRTAKGQSAYVTVYHYQGNHEAVLPKLER